MRQTWEQAHGYKTHPSQVYYPARRLHYALLDTAQTERNAYSLCAALLTDPKRDPVPAGPRRER